MDTISTTAAKAPSNEPRDLLSRLYREIGIAAVAAALAPATSAAEQAPIAATRDEPPAAKIAA